MPTPLASSSIGASIANQALAMPRNWPKELRAIEAHHASAARPIGAVLRFGQGCEIYGEGDAADAFFKVASGVVRTCKFFRDGRRQIDGFHVAGDIFGVEITTEYTLSAEAVCDCTVISYRQHGLGSMASDDTTLSQQLFSYAMQSLARAQEHALLLGRKSAVEKVAAFLIAWAKRFPPKIEINLAMTRQDMADYLGLTIETVSRTLSYLERARIVEFVTPRQIRLRDPAALEELSS